MITIRRRVDACLDLPTWIRNADLNAVSSDALLCAQRVGSVNWVACKNTAVEYAQQHGDRSPTFIEIGPGKVLKGLMAREVREDPVTGTKPHVLSVGTAAEIDAILLQAQDEGWLER